MIHHLAWELAHVMGATLKKIINGTSFFVENFQEFSSFVNFIDPFFHLNSSSGVPILAQWKQIPLRTMRLQV